MRGLWLALALAVMPIGSVGAIDARGDYAIYGPGLAPCSQWLREREIKSALAMQDQSWVIGYVTAYNRWVSKKTSVVGDQEPRALYAWIDDFCTANSKETLAGAAESLILEMMNRP